MCASTVASQRSWNSAIQLSSSRGLLGSYLGRQKALIEGSPSELKVSRWPGGKVRTMARRAVIRRLGIGERERIRDHPLRLEGEDRLLRFGGHASDPHIAAYCERLDWSRVLTGAMSPAARSAGSLSSI